MSDKNALKVKISEWSPYRPGIPNCSLAMVLDYRTWKMSTGWPPLVVLPKLWEREVCGPNIRVLS